MKRPYCVALTGGIGSGKSSVADCFARLGVEVVDTDLIARELTTAHSPLLQTIAEVFGPECLSADGSLDRQALRRIVFSAPDRRARLEGILYPRIRENAEQRVNSANSEYVLLVVPLLVESDAYWDIVDRVLVVDCPSDLQVRRIMQRDGIDRHLAEAMVAAQAGREARLMRADDVIDNSGENSDLDPSVRRLHEVYLQAAKTGLT